MPMSRMNPAVNYTRFEAIFLAGVRKGGMPEEYLPKGIERKFTTAPRISSVVQSSSGEPSSASVD